MTRSLILTIILITSFKLQSQIAFDVSGTSGYSLAGNQSLLPSTWVNNASAHLSLGSGRVMYAFGAGLTRMSTSNPYLKNQGMHFLSLGANFLIKPGKHNLLLSGEILRARIHIVPDSDKFPDGYTAPGKSSWNQWGMCLSGHYYLNRWFGLTGNLTYCFPRAFDEDNRQAYITIGCVLRLLYLPESEVDQKME